MHSAHCMTENCEVLATCDVDDSAVILTEYEALTAAVRVKLLLGVDAVV